MRKSLELQRELGPVFDITFDCEDGAQRGGEDAQRELIVRLLTGPDNRFDAVGVRVHDLDHAGWESDIEYFLSRAGDRIAHVTIPKARDYDAAARAVERVETVRIRLGLARTIPIHLLVESQGAVRDVWRIATLPGLRGLDFGIMDFVSSHSGAIPSGAIRTPGQFEHRLLARAKSEIVAAALAHGLVPSHNVTLDLTDPAVVQGDATRARTEFGFLRMWSIHPLHIPAIVGAFAPDFSAVEKAGEILLAAQRAAWGPIRHGAELFDRASYRILWNTLERAERAGITLPSGVKAAFF